MTKKKLIKILANIIILLIIGIGVFMYCDYRLEMVDVYVTKYSLSPRTLISDDEIERVRVPANYLNDEVILNKNEIVGKYVKINCLIPKGSFLYKGSLDNIENMKDKINSELKSGEVSFDLYSNDVKVNQACILKGMYVDLYLTINSKTVVSDILLNNVKIIGLYDNNNNEIKDYDTSSILNTISLAVPKEYVNYLNKAVVIGELSILIGNDSYKDSKTTLNKNSAIFDYLQ